jgi:hypothetical protein
MKKRIRIMKSLTAIIAVMVLNNYVFFAQNPLATLPSAPGPTVDTIKKLGNNKWVNLGSPAADPKYGRATGRSWGGKGMIPIPDRRGAFIAGEGYHAYVKPNGYGDDDYWFYDINTHRWICLFPGTDTKNFNNRVKKGTIKLDPATTQVIDDKGEPIPGHLLVHAWSLMAYDTDRKRIGFQNQVFSYTRYFLPGAAAIDSGLKVLEAQGMNSSTKPMSPWFYNTTTGKFEHYIINANRTFCGGFPLCLYIPTKKQYFLAGESAVTYYDPSSDKWLTDVATGVGPAGYDFGGCYDPKRDRVYMGQHADSFFWYDIKTATWNKIACPQAYVTDFTTNSGSVSYDAANDMVLIFDFKQNLIFPFNPADNTWWTPFAMDTKFSTTRKDTYCSFYDATLGVHFVFTASDSQDDAVIWIFRYKKSVTGIMDGTDPAPINLSTYPNPFNNTTTIKINGTYKLQAPTVEVFDMLGQVVYSEKTTSEKLENGLVWDAAEQKNGIYLVSVKDQSTSVVSRVVLMK